MQKLLAIFILAVAILTLSLGHATSAQAQDIESLCDSLDRPKIDCNCVASRMARFKNASTSPIVKTLLSERYAHALGKDNKLEAAEMAYRRDSMAMLTNESAYDRIGGMPGNISDFEEGCVIADAPTFKFAEPRANTLAADYVSKYVRDVGVDYRDVVLCDLQQFQRYLTNDERNAYYAARLYMHPTDQEKDDVIRAEKMGISTAQYSKLITSASTKINNRGEIDESYCSAMTHANRVTEAQNQKVLDAQKRQNIEAEKLPSASDFLSGNDETKARRLMQAECSANGSSDSYCQCVMADFERKVINQSPRPGVTLAWTLMRSGSGVPDEVKLQMMMTTDTQDQQDAGQLFLKTMDVGDNCVEPKVEVKALKGSARERMIEICMADTGDETICACTTDKMRESLDADSFEFIVDIREAEARGVNDPLSQVAADRGLSEDQAAMAMMNNQSLMSGSMAMNMISCMGGMPNMPNGMSFPIPN